MIPKIIHYCWFGGKHKPKLVRQCIKSWKKYNPDYILKEWNEGNSPIEKYPFAKQAFDKKKWAFVSDVIRLHALLNEGGLYLDTDVECLKSFDPLLENKLFTGYERDSNKLQTAVLGAEVNNPIVEKWLNIYLNISFSDDRKTMSLLVNNRLQTDSLLKMGIEMDGSAIETEMIKIFPSDYFCPMSYIDHSIKKTNNTFCIHYYSFSWTAPESLKGYLRNYLILILGEKVFRKTINYIRGV